MESPDPVVDHTHGRGSVTLVAYLRRPLKRITLVSKMVRMEDSEEKTHFSLRIL